MNPRKAKDYNRQSIALFGNIFAINFRRFF